jgi:AraC family transcriptional regulator
MDASPMPALELIRRYPMAPRSIQTGVEAPNASGPVGTDITTPAGHSAQRTETCVSQSWLGVHVVLRDVSCDGSIRIGLRNKRMQISVLLDQAGGRTQTVARSSMYDLPPRNVNRGPISLIPADTDVWIQGEKIRVLRLLTVEFDDIFLPGIVPTGTQPPREVPLRLRFSDRRIERLCVLIADECARNEELSRPYVDSLTSALCIAVGRSVREDTEGHRGGLAAWQLRCISEYLDSHLAEDISLDRLASIAGLSRSHFCRAFRHSMGVSPYQWLLRARIDRSKDMLMDETISLPVLAGTLGFADQAHFTRTFKRFVEESPRAWQRARRNGIDREA